MKWRTRRWKEGCQRNIERKEKEIFCVWLHLFNMNIFITHVKHTFLIIYLCIQEAPVLLPSNSYVFWEINSLDKLQLKFKMLKTSSLFSLYSAIKEQGHYFVLFNKIKFSSSFKLKLRWIYSISCQETWVKIFGIGFWLQLLTIQFKSKFKADQRMRLASIYICFASTIATKNAPAETPIFYWEKFKLLDFKK